jgi:hypothetical protein
MAFGRLDYVLTQHIAIKPIQVEYVTTEFDSARPGGPSKGFGSQQNDGLYSAGVFAIGRKVSGSPAELIERGLCANQG